jgi:hypothetical protein
MPLAVLLAHIMQVEQVEQVELEVQALLRLLEVLVKGAAQAAAARLL